MAAALNLRGLRAVLQQHLTAALDELFGNLQETFTEYEQEITRHRRLLDLLAEKTVQNHGETGVRSPAERVHSARPDSRTKPGSKGQSLCTVTVKTEEGRDQPLVQNPLQIRVHSPVTNQDDVRNQFLTLVQPQPQDPQPDVHDVKEEISQEHEMELDSDLVLDYDPLMLLVPDSEDPQDPQDSQDPGAFASPGSAAVRNHKDCGFSSAQSAVTEKTTLKMASSSKTSHYWSNKETAFMLAKLKDFEITKCMDGRKKRNGDIFKRVSCALAKAGYVRTAEQIRVRWKNIKKVYYDVQRLNKRSGYSRESCPHMEILEDLLTERPTAQTGEHGVESDSKTVAPPEPDGDAQPQSGLSANEEGDVTPTRSNVFQPTETSTLNVSSPKSPPRKRALPSATALDSYLERLDKHQKGNAERHRKNMELRERTHQENKELLRDLVATNKVLADFMMGQIRQLPSTASAPQT